MKLEVTFQTLDRAGRGRGRMGLRGQIKFEKLIFSFYLKELTFFYYYSNL